MERVVKWFIATLKGQYTVCFTVCGKLATEHMLTARPETRRWDLRRR
jgi:hypothetical protein